MAEADELVCHTGQVHFYSLHPLNNQSNPTLLSIPHHDLQNDSMAICLESALSWMSSALLKVVSGGEGTSWAETGREIALQQCVW